MRRLLLAVILFCWPGLAWAGTAPDALSQAVRAMCDRQIVLLGESDHGAGATVAFKAALVERLITECGFKAVLFESSAYDFAEYRRRIAAGEAVSSGLLSRAIGGIWNRDPALGAMVPGLHRRALAGQVHLAGFDDQLGSAGSFFGAEPLVQRLIAWLPQAERDRCGPGLSRRVAWTYTKAEPYSQAEADRLDQCVALIGAWIPDGPQQSLDDDLVTWFGQALRRDFLPPDYQPVARDWDMASNLLITAARLPEDTRIIVWTASVHAAKTTQAITPYRGRANLGQEVARKYGERSFALGFTAVSGSSWDIGRRKPRPLGPAGAGSLEQQALGRSPAGAAFLDRAVLARIGTVTGSAIRQQPIVADWSAMFDGMIVLREERPGRSQ